MGLDYDQLAVLRCRLNRIKCRDPHLGCEIIAFLLLNTDEGAASSAWLRQPNSALDPCLDITGSVDAAQNIINLLGLGSMRQILYGPEHGKGATRVSPYTVSLSHRLFNCIGSRWTEPTCLVDVAIQAIALSVNEYYEEELPPPEKGIDAGLQWSEVGVDECNTSTQDDTSETELWSEEIKRSTREALIDAWSKIRVIGLRKLYLKNHNGRFGSIESYELDRGVLRVVDRYERTFIDFETIDSLIAAGCVID